MHQHSLYLKRFHPQRAVGNPDKPIDYLQAFKPCKRHKTSPGIIEPDVCQQTYRTDDSPTVDGSCLMNRSQSRAPLQLFTRVIVHEMYVCCGLSDGACRGDMSST